METADESAKAWELQVNRRLNAVDKQHGEAPFEELKAAYDHVIQELEVDAKRNGLLNELRRLVNKRLFMEAYHRGCPLDELEQYFDVLESSGDTFSGLSRQIVRVRYLIAHGKHDAAREHLGIINEHLAEAQEAIDDLIRSL